MKIFLLVASLLAVVMASKWEPVEQWRLIEFNETYRQWLPLSTVMKMAEECGKPDQPQTTVVGFFDVTDHPDLSAENPIDHSPPPSSLRFQSHFKKLNATINPTNIRATIEALSNFNNRYYTSQTGADAANYIKNQFQNYINAAGRKDATVELFSHSWVQPSVIATIKGKSAEKVIIGAHEDSIVSGMTVNSRAPGADDDASGTATVLEAFRVLSSDPTFQPEKTVEFHTYSAEEVGLRGSQDIASFYKSRGYKVRGMCQFDMTAYKNVRPAIVTDNVDAALTNFLKTLVTQYTTLSWTTTTCGYGCSDHASWYKAGYASAFPFETIFSSSNKAIHTKDDLLSKLDMNQASEFASLAVGFVLELSG